MYCTVASLSSTNVLWIPSFFSDIIETSAVRGDGLIESMDWLVGHLGATQFKKASFHGQPVTPRVSAFSNVAKCDTSTDALKDRSPSRDYCNRAYSAFKCFFIRPSVPPDIDD